MPPDTSDNPPYIVGVMTWGYDTVSVVYYGNYTIKSELRSEQAEKEYLKLKRSIIKVYPYAQRAVALLHEIDEISQNLDRRRDKKQYMNQLEDELRQQFEKDLRNMTVTQGKSLVKIVERETGRKMFDIIKDLKNPLTAGVMQMVAKRWGYDLKEGYDPQKYADMEKILLQIETYGIETLAPQVKADSSIFVQSEAAKQILEKKMKKEEEKRKKEQKKKEKSEKQGKKTKSEKEQNNELDKEPEKE